MAVHVGQSEPGWRAFDAVSGMAADSYDESHRFKFVNGLRKGPIAGVVIRMQSLVGHDQSAIFFAATP
jgi:hypothetical protein